MILWSSPLTLYTRSELINKVAELFIVRASGYGLDSLRKYPQWELSNNELTRLLAKGVGGVILYGGTILDIKNRTQQLKSWSHKQILLCADVEEGVGQRFEGATWLVPPMALGLRFLKSAQEAIAFAERYGEVVGEQARSCGLNWVLAPVCDINTNPENPVINMRAWGDDPHSVAQLVCAFNKGLSSQGVLSCAKHFPGHGDTSCDSHLLLPILEHDFSRLEEIELVPFKALIKQGLNSVMTAHLLLQKIDNKFPATLSEKILSNLLRKRIGFNGLIVTDALVMKAISQKYSSSEAALMAFKAGADLIMMPENPDEAINAIVNSLSNGSIPIERLHQSLERRQNEIMKLNECKLHGPSDSFKSSSKIFEEGYKFSDQLINLSIQTNNIKLKDFKGAVNLIRVDKIFSNPFLNEFSPALSIPRSFGLDNIISHNMAPDIFNNDLNSPLKTNIFGDKKIILQLFMRGNPFVEKIYSKDFWISVIKYLQSESRLLALLVYGSFYVWESLFDVLDSSIPALYSPGQMSLAQKKALEYLFNENSSNEFSLTISNSEVEFTN